MTWRNRQAENQKTRRQAIGKSRRPHDGKTTYMCPHCKRSHLRWSVVGRLHKAYFERPSA